MLTRKAPWIWILAAWFYLIRFSEYCSLQIDLGHPLTWVGCLRYTAIELGFWLVMSPIVSWWARKFPLQKPLLLRNAGILLSLNLATALVHSLYRVQSSTLVYPGIPIQSFWGLSRAYFFLNAFEIAWFFWAVVGIHHAVESARKSHDRERELIRAQLELLKGQLQPHFLFNTLNSISWLMREDVEAADNMVTSLGELLRTTLNVRATEEVTLRQELETLELYLGIEKARFPERLRVSINADRKALDCHLPCLLLQPIVENAVRHGISRLDRPGLVEIRAIREDSELALVVEDDGPGLDSDAAPREGIGLANTRARLEKHYGRAQRFHYTNRSEGGWKVEIRIPAREGQPAGAEERSESLGVAHHHR
jgi:two-component system, LytTR family, sensor kinase